MDSSNKRLPMIRALFSHSFVVCLFPRAGWILYSKNWNPHSIPATMQFPPHTRTTTPLPARYLGLRISAAGSAREEVRHLGTFNPPLSIGTGTDVASGFQWRYQFMSLDGKAITAR